MDDSISGYRDKGADETEGKRTAAGHSCEGASPLRSALSKRGDTGRRSIIAERNHGKNTRITVNFFKSINKSGGGGGGGRGARNEGIRER